MASKSAMPARNPIAVAIVTVRFRKSTNGRIGSAAVRSTRANATIDPSAITAHRRLASDNATSTSVVERNSRRPPGQSTLTCRPPARPGNVRWTMIAATNPIGTFR